MTILGNILFWTFLIGIPLLCIITFIVDERDQDCQLVRILKGIGVSILFEILFLILFCCIIMASHDASKSYVPIDSTCVQQRIYTNLVDTNSNDFLIGIKNEHGSTTYNFFVEDSGVFKLDAVKTDNFNIVYSNVKYPTIEYHKKAHIYPTKFLWIFDENDYVTSDCGEDLMRRGTIYLPNKK